jgi:putative Holliday junction resolvase
VAVGDSATGVVSPVEVVEVNIMHGQGGPLLASVARIVEEHLGDNPRLSPGEVVVGLPLNMDGTEGPRARTVRAFAERLRSRTGRALHYQDERLSTVQADWSMGRSGMTHQQKKERRDALAAAAILTDFLQTLRDAPHEPPTPGSW